MKNRVIFYMVCTCISLSSCLDKNNLNLSDRDKEEELDLSFDFGMISEKKLEVTTRSNSGSAIPDVPFYVYLENPYTEEGDRRTDIFPLYSGKTAESGTIKATLAVPNTATTLYVYTPVSSFEMIQTCEIQNNMNITFTTTGVNAKSAKARAGGEGVFTGRRNAKVIEASTNLYSFYNFQLTDGASGGIINDGKSNDKDYNDILFKVTSDPIMKPKDEIPVAPEEYVSSISGTLAFEDNWPQKGDYDFNDFVTGYSYSLIKGNNDKDVKAIRLTFIPRALGASYNSGFGIQLPIETNNIENVTGGNIEKDETKATIIIYEDTRKDAFGGHGGFINTQKGNAEIAGTKQNVYITLKSNIGLNSFKDFNPFIYVVNRNHEIHLTDKAPTSKMDISLFGREEDDDCSMPEKGYYYRMDNDYPWALDIPSSNNSLNNLWRYPIEGKGVSEAYPDYLNWTSASGHHINWLDKQNSAYIY